MLPLASFTKDLSFVSNREVYRDKNICSKTKGKLYKDNTI